jgi:hypothetical protein
MIGCGNCHKKGENLMSRGSEKSVATKEDLLKRRREDTFCIPCHNAHGSNAKGAHSGGHSMAISGILYCPKDKLRFSPDTNACSKCGGMLLNIDEVMTRSRRNPSNEICKECHLSEEVRQIGRHAIYNQAKLRQCLDCPKGHDDCASCHH